MYNILKIKIMLLIICFIFSINENCSELSYNYLQASYVSISVDPDVVNLSGTGFDLSGSFDVNNNVALSMSFNVISFDRIVNFDFDRTEITVGFIAHTKISTTTDVLGGISIVNSAIKIANVFSTFAQDETGNKITVGIRKMVLKNFEFNISVIRTDLFNESITFIVFGAQFYTDKNISLGTAFSANDDEELLLFNLRIGF